MATRGGTAGGRRGAGDRDRVRVVAAVIRDEDGAYLLTKRAEHAVLPGYWEFPGGKVEEGEDDESALKREVAERICADVEVGRLLAERHHDYGDYEVLLRIYEARITGGEVCRGNVADFAWVPSDELEGYDFPPADRKAMDLLLERTPPREPLA